MRCTARRAFFWAPRTLCILFIAFVSAFALDVFHEGYSIGEAIIAFLMHLVPTYLLIVALLIAWRWEGIGAVLFAALGFAYLITSGWDAWVISGPMFLVAALFLLGRFFGRRPDR